MSRSLHLSRDTQILLVPLKIVLNCSRFKAGAQLKSVFGGFETRHKFIKFGHWYQPGFFDKVLNTSKSRPVQGKVWVPIIKSEFGSHFPKVNNPHPSSARRTPRMLNRIAIAKSIITRYQSAENWKLNWTQTYFSFIFVCFQIILCLLISMLF